jgi:hypothetical protein
VDPNAGPEDCARIRLAFVGQAHRLPNQEAATDAGSLQGTPRPAVPPSVQSINLYERVTNRFIIASYDGGVASGR